MKKILIIGSNGFIGSTAVQYYITKGYSVIGCDILKHGKIPTYFKVDNKRPDYDKLFNDFSPDICLNASGAANVPFSFDYPIKDFELNVNFVIKILEAIRKSKSNTVFINISSAAVYGTPSQLPINEEAKIAPISPYGWHKRQSELLCYEYANLYGIKTCSMRVFSAYGPGLKKQLFWDLYQKTLNEKVINLLGKGNESRDYIFVDDLVCASETIAINSKLQGEVINVGSGIETTIEEASSTFIKALEWDGEIHFSGFSREGDPKNWCADITKIKDMGFNSEISLEIGLQIYCKWLLNHPQL